MFKLTLTILFSFFSFNYVNAEITEDMKKRAKEAGVVIERDHDPKRTYLANDFLARDTHMNMQLAYRHAQNNDPEKAAALTLNFCKSRIRLRASLYWKNVCPRNWSRRKCY